MPFMACPAPMLRFYKTKISILYLKHSLHLTLMQSIRWQANGLRHHCYNGASHGIMPQDLEVFPKLKYKQKKWSVVHTSKTQNIVYKQSKFHRMKAMNRTS